LLTTPTHVAVGLVVIGAVLLWTRWRRAARLTITSGTVLLFAPPAGVIVLGGSTDAALA
jgi:hypothetical protein